MKHIPGPWRVKIHDSHQINGRAADCSVWAGEEQICHVTGPDATTARHSTTGFTGERVPGANALLISLAPDLAAMLRRFVDGINDEIHPLFWGGGLLSDEERTLLVQAGALLKKVEE